MKKNRRSNEMGRIMSFLSTPIKICIGNGQNKLINNLNSFEKKKEKTIKKLEAKQSRLEQAINNNYEELNEAIKKISPK